MKGLRTFASALCIIVGAALLAAWVAAMAALTAIEDSTVIEDAAARVIQSDSAQLALVTQGSDAVITALADQGVNTDIPGLKAAVRTIVESIVSSDEFTAAVNAQVKSVREQVVANLNGDNTGPIVVTLDFTDEVNKRVEQIPIIGPSIPDLTVPGVDVQVIDAETADSVRSAWDALHWIADWCGWLALAVLALGMLVSHRRRWYLAKAALAIAVLSGIGWAIVKFVQPSTIESWIPGEGVADQIIVEIFRDDAAAAVAKNLGIVALGAAIVAVVLFILSARARGPKKGSS